MYITIFEGTLRTNFFLKSESFKKKMYKIKETIAKSLISTSLNSNIIKCENVKKVVSLQCGKPKPLMRTQFCLKDFVSLSYTLRHSGLLSLSL